MPFLSDIPTIGSLFQKEAEPAVERAVPILAELPILGDLFQNTENPREGAEPDSSPPAGEFEVSFNFGELSDLLKYERRCANEGGKMVITSLYNPAPGSDAVGGTCRVFDLTVEGKNRFIGRTPTSGPLSSDDIDHAIIQYGAGLQVWCLEPSPEIESLRSEIRNLERRLAQLEIERLDLESAVASRRQKIDALLGKRHAAPSIRGQVLFLSETASGPLAVINRGSDEGVKVGTTFEIYREATYKGRVEVTDVQGDTCFGKILLAPWPMNRGDQATTKL